MTPPPAPDRLTEACAAACRDTVTGQVYNCSLPARHQCDHIAGPLGAQVVWDDSGHTLNPFAVEVVRQSSPMKSSLTVEVVRTSKSAPDRLTALTRSDWRYQYLHVSESTRETAEVLSSDTETAVARVTSCLDTLGTGGAAGAYLDNTSLLAMRHVLHALAALRAEAASLQERLTSAELKAAAYDRINTPEMFDFLSAVHNEALHQRVRWGVDADGGKTDGDWFWLVGYLAGKALHDVKGKRLHHLITAAAALLNWHGHATGNYARMRPGIATPEVVEASK